MSEVLPFKRLALARVLLDMRAQADRVRNTPGAIKAGALIRGRMVATRRKLLGRAGASDALDDFMTPGLAAERAAAEWAAAKDQPHVKRVAVAFYLRDMIAMLRRIRGAERQAGLGDGLDGNAEAVALDDLHVELNRACGAQFDAATADPLIDDFIGTGAFGDQAREELAQAAGAAERAVPGLTGLKAMMAEQWDKVRAQQEQRYRDTMAIYARMTMSDAESVAAYNAASNEYNEWLQEVYKPISEAHQEKLRLKREAENAAHAVVGRKLIDSVLAGSAVSADAATAWAAAQTVTTSAKSRLKKMGYPVETLRADMAEFYRFTGGRVTSVVIDSKGDRRANATDIEEHGKVGAINLGSSFDRRVLWHELAHHMEADPVAKMASGRYIRRRSQDGKVYTLRSLTGINYGKKEVAYNCGFFDAYVGKKYDSGITEVFSMGVESFSDPAMLARRAIADPQTLEFVAGFCRQPMSDLSRAHMAMRDMLQDITGEVEEASENWLEATIKQLSDRAPFVPDTDRYWIAGVSAGWMLDEFKQLGRFQGSDGDTFAVYVLSGKIRNPSTGRKGNGMILAMVYADGGLVRHLYPGATLEVARAAHTLWVKNGVFPHWYVFDDQARLQATMGAA